MKAVHNEPSFNIPIPSFCMDILSYVASLASAILPLHSPTWAVLCLQLSHCAEVFIIMVHCTTPFRMAYTNYKVDKQTVKKSYSLLDVTMFISPDAMCCGARCSHVVTLNIMLSCRGGYLLQCALAMPWLWNFVSWCVAICTEGATVHKLNREQTHGQEAATCPHLATSLSIVHQRWSPFHQPFMSLSNTLELRQELHLRKWQQLRKSPVCIHQYCQALTCVHISTVQYTQFSLHADIARYASKVSLLDHVSCWFLILATAPWLWPLQLLLRNCDHFSCCSWQYTITGLDYWTGLLDQP